MQFGTAKMIFEDDVGEQERYEQSIGMMLSSFEGSFPCNRKFGIRPDIIDQPVPIAKMEYVQDVSEKMEMFFPELLVDDISFEQSTEGMRCPHIFIAVNEDFEIDEDEDFDEDEVGEEDEYERF